MGQYLVPSSSDVYTPHCTLLEACRSSCIASEIVYLGLGTIIVSKGCTMGLHNPAWHLEAQSYNSKESGSIMVWVYTLCNTLLHI